MRFRVDHFHRVDCPERDGQLTAQSAGGLTAAEADAHKAKLVELKTALQAVAAKHQPPGA